MKKNFLLKNPYKINFYEKEISSIIKNISYQNKLLDQVDKIVVLNKSFKNLLVKRKPKLENKIITANLLSFKKDSFFFDESIRNEYRLFLNWKNYPIISYVGNVYYSWQNLSKTIKFFKRIQKEINSTSKLLLLIRKEDHHIALDFLEKEQIQKTDYYLNQVDNNEIYKYLNAADLGVVIRDFHPMNTIVTSGKILDYLASGLPVVTTSIINKLPREINKFEFGYVMEDVKIENIDMSAIKEILNFDSNKRKKISTWANNNLSIDSSVDKYVEYLKIINHQKFCYFKHTNFCADYDKLNLSVLYIKPIWSQ